MNESDLWALTGENFGLLTPEEQARLLRDLAHYAEQLALDHPRRHNEYLLLGQAAYRLADRLDERGLIGSHDALPADPRLVANLSDGVSRWAKEQARQPDHDLTDDDRRTLRLLQSRAADLAADLDPERKRQLEWEREGR